ncbi:MAG: N-acetylglucosamine-6-phosphate deacetylase [Emcibacter sp.]|nr:N-acetylglucosamine-6-phosphate deacetylase [Emcibacter sp.]
MADSLFDGERLLNNMPLTIEGGRILCLDEVPGTRISRLKGLIAPGFIDVQLNGGGGVLFNSTPTVETINLISTAHNQYGTTGFLATLISDDLTIMKKAADAVSSALKNNMSTLLGIHFEGPHISTPKRGVHSEDYIRELSEEELAIYARKDIGICHVTVAPEKVSPDVIKLMTAMGIIVSLGHSNADFETVQRALDAGAKGFTHLFNAMSPLQGREPGMVGAALLSQNTWCGLIVDGHHVHNASAKIAITTKPQGKIILVTDAMPPVGTKDTSFDLLGTKATLSKGKLTLNEGQLAGSALDMAKAVKNTIEMLDVPFHEALRMASVYPAEFMGLDSEIGRLKEGMRANFILLDNNVNVMASWVAGKQQYKYTRRQL